MARVAATLALVLALAGAANARAAAAPSRAPAPVAATLRRRRVDALPRDVLFPSDMHARTRATHKRMMSSWRAPVVDAAAPTVYPVDFGADPTGKTDSTAAFAAAMKAVLAHNSSGHSMSDGIADLGGVVLDLQGGDYLLSAPLVVPQYVGNMHIVDGTLRAAAAAFPAARYVIEIGAASPRCNPPSGQGSCNENVGMHGLTLDGSHVAAGCLQITAAMGVTLDSSSAIFGFVSTGIAIDGGHETMIEETWVAAYFWNSPQKERNSAVGIGIFGNDHYVTNTIVFSARVGVQLTGAANILNGVHTWNCATGNGGTGILNQESQNRFEGVYLDFTHLQLAGTSGAQQTSVSGGFFLGGAQIVFSATKQGEAVYGVSLTGNTWFDTNAPALAVNETLGTWTAVTDLVVTGTALQQGESGARTPSATLVVSSAAGGWNARQTVDFSKVLLFPRVPIQSATAQIALAAPASGTAAPPYAVVERLPNAASPLAVAVYAPFPGTPFDAPIDLIVRADQSAYTSRT